ncbi:MAG: response regulator [Croceivirga sp.]
MFKKVLVVEDLDTVGYGIVNMLQNELEIKEVTLTQYCDEGYLKFQRALQDEAPFELVISDLSFVQDHRPSTLSSGSAFIHKIREQGHQTPIIICTVDEKPDMATQLMKQKAISAYVLKGRHGLTDLKKAIASVFEGQSFVSDKVKGLTRKKMAFEIKEYDISILSYLSNGFTQEQIAVAFKTNSISPNSLSTIEKRLNKLKDVLKANNNVQLVANAKDLGLI